MPNNRDSSDTRAPNEPAHLREYAQWEDGGDALVGLNLEKMHAELSGQIAQERGFAAWLRSRPTPLRAMLASFGLGVIVIVTMAVWLRPDFDVYPAGRMQAVLLTIAGLIALEMVLVLWPLQLPAAPQWLMGVAVIAAPIGLFFWYSAPAAHVEHPRSIPAEGIGVLAWHAVRCLGVGSIVAGGVYALLRGLDRGGTNRLLLMAACAGLAGNLLLQLHCPMTSPMHLVIGHLGVIALCFGFAVWRERIEFAPRRARRR
jgi:hypothetical protein